MSIASTTIEQTSAPAPLAQRRSKTALHDLFEGLKRRELWMLIGAMDIRARYQRSFIGQFWHALTAGVLIGTMSFVMSHLQGQSLTELIPYVAVAYTLWLFLVSVVNESCFVFISAKSYALNTPLPWSVFVYALIYRNLLLFAHNLALVVFIFVLFRVVPSWTMLLSVGIFALILLNMVWMALLCGLATARFRDVQHVVQSMMMIAFFFTPVMFRPINLPPKFLDAISYNPFTSFISAYSLPFFGQMPRTYDLMVIIGTAIVGWAITLFAFSRLRNKIAYWL